MTININRILSKVQTLYKFHFHESTLFKLMPQTSIINKAILDNKNSQFITKSQQEGLQKSFKNVLQSNENDMEYWGDNKTMNKLYSQAYYPFLSKEQLESSFKNTMNAQILRNHVLKHIRLNDDAFHTLQFLTQKPIFDFGVLRSSYFPSLGITKDYSQVMKSANYKAFRYHFEKDHNYSKPLTSNDHAKNELILTEYLKNSSKMHRGVSSFKNFFVINSPEQSEFFISLSSKLGVSTIVITGENYITPSSTINNLIKNYEIAKTTRNLVRCQDIHNQLSNMKLISVKSMQELMIMMNILQDPYVRTYDASDRRMRADKPNFNLMLNDLELSILGEIETDSVLNRYR